MKRNEVTLKLIKLGLERFYRENNHYPIAPEIDKCSYLPSSRQIQRKFGGLPAIRKQLGFKDLDYSKGVFRSKMASSTNILSSASEGNVRDFLNKEYGELCIHEEKKYGKGKNRVDFFIYAKTNFGVEVFNTYTLRNLAKNMNIKLKKFYDYKFYLYFVVTGEDFNQTSIDRLINRKKHLPLLKNMKCYCFETFKNECLNKFPPLKITTSYQKIYS